jgi:hypothetical protein
MENSVIIEEGKGEGADKKGGRLPMASLSLRGSLRGVILRPRVHHRPCRWLRKQPHQDYILCHATTYSVSTFVENDADLLDASCLTLLGSSCDGFVLVRLISLFCLASLELDILSLRYSDSYRAQVLQLNVT